MLGLFNLLYVTFKVGFVIPPTAITLLQPDQIKEVVNELSNHLTLCSDQLFTAPTPNSVTNCKSALASAIDHVLAANQVIYSQHIPSQPVQSKLTNCNDIATAINEASSRTLLFAMNL